MLELHEIQSAFSGRQKAQCLPNCTAELMRCDP